MLGLHNILRIIKMFSKFRQVLFITLFDVDHILTALNIYVIRYQLS